MKLIVKWNAEEQMPIQSIGMRRGWLIFKKLPLVPLVPPPVIIELK